MVHQAEKEKSKEKTRFSKRAETKTQEKEKIDGTRQKKGGEIVTRTFI
ncbi:hypothetical protein EMIT013CA1_130073 [Bacillus sp. IT-13CA1]